ncbi:MAG TPA: hypothetical protein VFQ54_05770, partial [Thermomicrobiales bacterium]|nr:hypothetical protein [Thermomicrobiales bacterium]
MRLQRSGILTAVVSLVFIGSAIATSAAAATAQDAATPAPLGAESCTVDPIDPTTYDAAIQKAIPPLPQ